MPRKDGRNHGGVSQRLPLEELVLHALVGVPEIRLMEREVTVSTASPGAGMLSQEGASASGGSGCDSPLRPGGLGAGL